MEVRLYNTLTLRKDPFVPLVGNTARIYSCGPTVYSTASIGNLRAYIFVDVLKKTLEMAGIGVDDVMNITDVGHLVGDGDEGEDKVEVSARKQGITPQDIAKRYADEFFSDCAKLNIRRPKTVAPATQYVPQMIEFIQGLERKGYTYNTSDGVYFDASKFADYFCLSRMNAEGNRAGARVELGEKRNTNDFALWKFVSPNTLQKWDSPWGVGCPGWHIECSAIALHHFGATFDIHTGGIDHIPIHHTNEIAQTQALTGVKMCKSFIHNEFMMVDGGKMSKSLGNVYTLAQLEARGFAPAAFRYFMLQTHYRKVVNFTFDALGSAATAYSNAVELAAKHFGAKVSTMPATVDRLRRKFRAAMANDLNTPQALAVLWEVLKMVPCKRLCALVMEFDEVLGLDIAKAIVGASITRPQVPTNVPAEVETKARERMDAKGRKDWATADKLRAEIAELGFEVVDIKDGYELRGRGQVS